MFEFSKIENFRLVYPKGKNKGKSVIYEEVMRVTVLDYTCKKIRVSGEI